MPVPEDASRRCAPGHFSNGLRNSDVHVWHVDLGGEHWRNCPDVLRGDEQEKNDVISQSPLAREASKVVAWPWHATHDAG